MTTRGHTLPELLLALVLIGLLAVLGVAPLLALRDTTVVNAEHSRLVEALDQARGSAVRLGVPTRLLLSDTGYVVTAVTVRGDSLLAWRSAGPAAHGVRLSGTGGLLQFGPGGIAMGVSNRTLILARGGSTRRVVVSRLGRITT